MLKRPRFKQTILTYLPDDGQAVVLLSDGEQHILSQPIYRDLVPLLDGASTVQQLAKQLSANYTLKDILGAIHLLQKWGYLVDADTTFPGEQSASWGAHGLVPPAQAHAAVAVRCFGQVQDQEGPFGAALAELGILPATAEATLDLVLTDDYLDPGLAEHNRSAQRPWLLVRPVGVHLWLGPLVVPGQTACWECLAHRLRQNRVVEQFVARATGTRPPLAALPTTLGLASRLAALHVAQFVASGRSEALTNALIVWNPGTLQTETHTIVQRPQCPVCGDPVPAQPEPIRLQQQAIQSTDGGYRSTSPELTLARYSHHVSPLTGIVRGLEPVVNADGIFVYRAKSLRAGIGESWHGIQAAERFVAGGKGNTEIQAKVSALCEALERYSSQGLGDEPLFSASYAELGGRAIDLRSIMHFSPTQYAQRDEYNPHSTMNRVPVPFDENVTIDWVKVWSLTEQEWIYLPAGYCYYNLQTQQPYVLGDSNGNAAGSSLEDAILQGFFELVERDCAAMWWYNRIPRPGVALEGIDDAWIAELTRYYSSLGLRYWVLDLTNDFGIPTFVALSHAAEGPSTGTSYGFGTHLDPRIAAIRALTEMNQLLPGILQHVEREDRQFREGPAARGTIGSVDPAEEPWLLPASDLPVRRIADYERPHGDINAMLQICLERVHALDMRFLVHNLTRADVGLPVVKVIVPGMRHFWRRLAPGRLYDVPVKLGWLDRPLREDQLNQSDIT